MRTTITATLLGLMLVISSVAPAVARPEPPLQQVIVVFNDSVADPARAANDLVAAHGGRIGFVYRHALKGFSATLSAPAVTAIQRNPLVAWIEFDQEVHLYAQEIPTGIQRIFADENTNIKIDGVDDLRINVDVAVIDTGIDLDHPDLNVVNSTNCSGGSPFKQKCSDGGDDDNGHGTHVAGTIGALDNGQGVVGVAPGARLWAVKVLNKNGSGYLSWIIAGIDWVTDKADVIEVANMSLGGTFTSDAFDAAIATSVAAGVAYAVAAGNSNKDAKNFSPANHPDVLTVSALADFDGMPDASVKDTSTFCGEDQDDTLADFSNWGSLIDITAPGVCILSTVPGGYATYSGTSMASPHAAGALALLASNVDTSNLNNADDRKTAVKNLYQTLIDTGNLIWTDDSGDGEKNKEPLLDVSDTTVFNPATVPGSSGGGDTNTAPVADDVAVGGDEDTVIDWTPSVSDTDNADTLSCSIVTAPDNGLATVPQDCSSGTYTPDLKFNGPDSFTYQVSDGSLTDTATVTITVGETLSTVHVGDLDGVAKIKGKSGKWEVLVTVTVHDADHSLVAGATVTGFWVGAPGGDISGITGSDGTVILSTGNLTTVSKVTFTVSDVAGADLTYEATSNDETLITVLK